MITPGLGITSRGLVIRDEVVPAVVVLDCAEQPGLVALGPEVVGDLEAVPLLGLGKGTVGAFSGAAVCCGECVPSLVHVGLDMGEADVDLDCGGHQVPLLPEHLEA